MSHSGRQGRMSEVAGSGAVILEEPESAGATSGQRSESQNQARAPLRCPIWPRQQTWLCVVPLLIGFVGLGLSLMLLKWIVVGTVRDYVPTDLVDANRIGQDPIFLSKPSGIPKSADTSTTTTTTTITITTAEGGNPTAKTVGRGRTRFTATTTAVNHRGGGAYGSQVTPRILGNHNGRHGFTTTTTAPRSTYTIGAGTTSPSPHNPTVLHDQTAMWNPEHTTTEAAATTTTTRSHGHHKTRRGGNSPSRDSQTSFTPDTSPSTSRGTPRCSQASREAQSIQCVLGLPRGLLQEAQQKERLGGCPLVDPPTTGGFIGGRCREILGGSPGLDDRISGHGD